MSVKIIHIAGTNGKGSTAHYINNILLAAGKRVGLFTSPHLLKWQERIQINGQPIEYPDDYEKNLFDGGYFINTAKLAKSIFEQADLDYMIIETGIGGKKDITMMFDADVAVITSIDKDHMDILGRSLPEIAAQKAGIIRKNGAVFSQPQKSAAARIIKHNAFMMRNSLEMLSKRQIKNIRQDEKGILFDFYYKDTEFKNIQLANYSRIQTLNAATAFMVAANEGITTPFIRQGLAMPISGRTHIAGKDMVLDVAHNAQAMKVLKEMVKRNYPGRRVNVMFALQKSKDIKEIAKTINQFAYRTFLIDFNDKKFFPPKDISRHFKRPHYLVGSGGGLKKSLEYARIKSTEENAVLVVCGSFYLTGAVYGLISSV